MLSPTRSSLAALTPRHRLYVGLFLVLLMALTRSHHVASLHNLPDASWAVFFLAGVYLRPALLLPVLCVMAAVIDWAAIAWGGVNAFCVSPAYAMLLPAYGSLWLGGRWYARHHRETLTTSIPLAGAIALSALAAELFSSGGFYFLGGHCAAPTLAAFRPRLVKYFPSMLGAMALYMTLAALLHALLSISASRRSTRQRQS